MTTAPAGIIFDMDDTLVSTSPLWRAAEEALLNAIGHAWTSELAIQYKGMNAYNVAATIHRLTAPSLSVAQCHRVMRDALLAEFERREAPAMAGAVECVRRAQRVAPLAVASGSPLTAIEGVLARLGIRDAFSVVLSSEQVARGKPFPDVFLAAAKRLHAPPERCLVFEDSLIGARAAQAAGMACFVVPSSSHNHVGTIATRVFNSLAEIGERDVRAALGNDQYQGG